MSTPVVELVNASKSFPGPPRVEALAPTCLTIDHGEAIAIVGPSGSGKSTLLSLLGTLDTPTNGEVLVEGYRTSQLRQWQRAAIRGTRLGFVFQQFHLLPRLTAQENVATGLFYSDVDAKERRCRSQEALERVGLAERMTHRPSQLSGGEQQRVAIARALVRSPSVLFADEPTGALDSRRGAAILELLLETSHQGTAVVIVTHDLAIAKQFKRQIHVLDGIVGETNHDE